MDYKRILNDVFKQLRGIGFAVLYWDSDKVHYGDEDKEQFCLVIKDSMTARSLLNGGSLGFGEAYADGRIEIEGDIQSYLKLRHTHKQVKKTSNLVLARLLGNFFSTKKKENRQRNIAHHYDLGNDFFSQVLDKETMLYSGAYFPQGKESLPEAQYEKMEYICRKLKLRKGQSLLDIGSGWGGFAMYAAKNYGVNVLGITLSEKQFSYAKEKVEQEGMSNNVKFIFKDFLEFRTNQVFDAIVSIECIEHIGKENIPAFFSNFAQLLKKNGRGLIQASAGLATKPTDRWTTTYIFPGGYFPSVEELANGIKQSELKILDVENLRQHYESTLDYWLRNFSDNQKQIKLKFGKKFVRTWWLWLNGAKISFQSRSLQLLQLVITPKGVLK